MADVPVFVVAPEIVVWQKKSHQLSTPRNPSVTETTKFARRVINILLHDVTNDVIIFERDSRHFTNVSKLTMTTGSLNVLSHEQFERLFR